MTRRVVAAILLVLLVVLAPTAFAGQSEAGPTSAAWWQVGPLALVTAAGLEDGQLLVDGFGADERSRQAVAALEFPFGDATGSSPSAVTLAIPVVSSVVPDANVMLCAVTADFDSVSNGAAEDVPPHDCNRSIIATIDGEGSLIATGVESLGDGGEHLRMLLVPAQPGRIVLDGVTATVTIQDSSSVAPTLTPSPRPEAPSADNPSSDSPSRGAPPDESASAPQSPDPSTSTEADASSPGSMQPPTTSDTVRAAAPGFRPPAGDGAARAMTALVVALGLGLFTALNRQGMARLRPAAVPWLPNNQRP